MLELGAVLELGQVAGDGHHDPEDPGDEGKHREAQEDQREAQLLELRAPLGRLGAREACRMLEGSRGGWFRLSDPSPLTLAGSWRGPGAQIAPGPSPHPGSGVVAV